MLKGLYKVEMHTVHGSRRGVLYVYDGKMMGGNSAFAFIGTYKDSDSGEVLVEISTLRHNHDPNFQPLFKTDKITLMLKGRQQGEQYHFEGGATQLPGIAFNSVMTPISEEAAPPALSVGKDGIKNGLYSIHIRMLDGIDGGNTGVMVLHDGRIRGGDGFFDYIGSYTCANGKWKGEIVNHEHLGVPPEHFIAFYVTLRDVFADVLGADWTPDIDAAWAELLRRIDDLLIKAGV